MAKKKRKPQKDPFAKLLPKEGPIPQFRPPRPMFLFPPRPPYGGYTKEEATAPIRTMPLTDVLRRHTETLWHLQGKNPFMSVQEII